MLCSFCHVSNSLTAVFFMWYASGTGKKKICSLWNLEILWKSFNFLTQLLSFHSCFGSCFVIVTLQLFIGLDCVEFSSIQNVLQTHR